jgi:hypothetical protein
LRGGELVGTLLDAGEHSLSVFVRQLVSIVVGGLLARSHQALSRPLLAIGCDALRWSAIAVIVRLLVGHVAIHLRFGLPLSLTPRVAFISYAGPMVILGLYTAGRDRVTGAVGLAWVGVGVIVSLALTPASHMLRGVWIELWLLPLAGFALMLLAPRSKAGAERFLWIIPGAAWAIVVSTRLGGQSGLGYLLPVLATVVLLPLQPALAVGTALAWSATPLFLVASGTQTAGIPLALLSCTPAALLLTGISRRVLRRT